jgi:pullulanase
LQVRFHYRREAQDYEGWKIHAYSRGMFGMDYSFKPDPQHPGFMLASVYVDPTKHDKLWFKIHKDHWKENDGKTNRSIRIKDFKGQEVVDVYLRSNEREKSFQTPPLLHTRVNVYYKRHENDYEGWGSHFFIDGKNNNQREVSHFRPESPNGLFHKASFSLDYLKGEKELNFYLRKFGQVDRMDFRSVALKEGEMDIYVLQDEARVATDRKTALALLKPKILKAVLENPRHSEPFNVAYVQTNTPIPQRVLDNAVGFRLVNQDGRRVLVKSAQHTDATKRRIQLTFHENLKPFDEKYDLTLSDPIGKGLDFDTSKRLDVWRLFDRWEFSKKYIHDGRNLDKKFGASFQAGALRFGLWAPTADRVHCHIYDKPVGGEKIQSFPMRFQDGVWGLALDKAHTEKFKNLYYTYEIERNGKTTEIMDPYAKSCGIGAQRGALVDTSKIEPPGWENHKRPSGKLKSPLIYEMSIRDFTSGEGSDVSSDKQGKFLGVVEKLEYFKKLGVNAIQLLPVSKFASDEWKKNGGAYNWGYDQLGYWFIPEGSYARNVTNPESRILEFKQMVQACHEAGVRVIVDAVHNHTYLTEGSVLNRVEPAYYYRQDWDDSFTNGSGCGNETKSERPMTQKLIRDYLKYWVTEMGVDGFRFDLMSITDKYTMQKIREDMDRIRPDVILYGEAYPMGWSILPYAVQASKDNIRQNELRGIGAFTDIGSRNAIRGYNYDPGLATGASVGSQHSHHFYLGQKGSFVDPKSMDNDTQQAMNYIDVHDDLLMVDFLKSKMQMPKEERMKRYKLAYSMLFNYIGPLVLKSGAEGVTTKHGEVNSYRTEEVNLINWNRMQKYQDMGDYFAAYIRFRKSHPAYMMDRQSVHQNFVVMDSHEGTVKGKMFQNHANNDPCEKLAIFHNLNTHEVEVRLPHEHSGWSVLANEKQVGNVQIGHIVWDQIKIPPLSTVVLGDHKSVEKMMEKSERHHVALAKERVYGKSLSKKEKDGTSSPVMPSLS